MVLTEKDLIERITQLGQQHQQWLTAAQQAEQNAVAIGGAIQLAQQLLEQLKAPEPTPATQSPAAAEWPLPDDDEPDSEAPKEP